MSVSNQPEKQLLSPAHRDIADNLREAAARVVARTLAAGAATPPTPKHDKR